MNQIDELLDEVAREKGMMLYNGPASLGHAMIVAPNGSVFSTWIIAKAGAKWRALWIGKPTRLGT